MVIQLLVELSASILAFYLGSHAVQSLSSRFFPAGERDQNLSIEVPGKSVVTWYGCLYRRVIHVPNKDDPQCGQCLINGTSLAVFKSQTKEQYRNCSVECKRPTLCTVFHYKIGPKKEQGPICYECDRMYMEIDVMYKFRRSHQICSDECKKCGREVDLAAANSCAFVCDGKPTFCYPPRSWFGHEVCHQADYTHGCIYKLKPMKELVDERKEKLLDCLNCAKLTAEPGSWSSTYENVTRYAQLCAPACEGNPVYAQVNPEMTSFTVYVCTLTTHLELLEIDIPEEVKQFINPQNPKLIRNITYSPLY